MLIGCLRLVMSALSAVLSTRVRRRRKFGQVFVRSVQSRGMTLNDPDSKNGNSKSRKGLFWYEFTAMCNHCRVMAAWSRKTLEFFLDFLLFWKNDPLPLQFSNVCFGKFSLRVICPGRYWITRESTSQQSGHLRTLPPAVFSNHRHARACPSYEK